MRGHGCVVVGRSNLFGKPMAQLLLAANATVTICHTGTKDMAFHTRRAEILIVAAGKPNAVTADMVKDIVERANRGPGKIIYEEDPKILVEKVITLVRQDKIVEI